jgi:DNA repair/transcription protein MET18/MMS19
VKHNYLIALSHLLRNIPKQVLLSELPSVSTFFPYHSFFVLVININILNIIIFNDHFFFFFKLIPLLIHSLSSSDAELKSSTIDTFYLISADAPHIISEHVSSLIPLLLSSTKIDKGNTMVSTI